LVEERFRESEWARSQLADENFKNVHSVNSGLRDFEQFVGVANHFSANASAQSGSGDSSGSTAQTPTPIATPASRLQSDARESKAQVDAIKEFEFKEAVRDKINAAVRQVQLDDTHDLKGSTLYNLQFIVSVEPGRNTSEFAVVELRLRPPESEFCDSWQGEHHPSIQRLFASWRTTVSHEPRLEQTEEANENIKEFWRRICDPYWLSVKNSTEGGRDDYYIAYVQPSEYAQRVSDVLAREDFQQYATSLQGMVPNTPVHASNALEVVNRATELAQAATLQPLVVGVGNGRDRFGWILGPRFSVEGGEAAWRHVPTQYNVSAAISVPGWWPFLILEGRVGWRDRDGTTSWNRTPWYRSPVLSSVRDSAEVDSIEVREGDSRVDADSRDWLYFIKPRAPLWGEPLKVRLPGDMAALATAILERDRPGSIAPVINPSDDCKLALNQRRPCYQLTATVCAGEVTTAVSKTLPTDSAARGRVEQTLYIRGSELWRNAQVFVGSQKADRVDILPDMRGLLAHFNDVIFVPQRATRGPNQELDDLRVVTSVGEAQLPGAVAVNIARECKS
jgi:hypothetical protein